MYTQENYGSNGWFVSYDALAMALRNVKYYAQQLIRNTTTPEVSSILVGLPYYLSCGLAGGDWDTV